MGQNLGSTSPLIQVFLPLDLVEEAYPLLFYITGALPLYFLNVN